MSRIIMNPTRKVTLPHVRDELDNMVGKPFQWVNAGSSRSVCICTGVCIKIIRKNESLLNAVPYGWPTHVCDRSRHFDRAVMREDSGRLRAVIIGKLNRPTQLDIPDAAEVAIIPRRRLLRRPS